jgi:molybdopterin synthase catalytic subunit
MALYEGFLARETDADGTIILHHGRVKRPGKQIALFSSVELRALVPDVNKGLEEVARRAKEKFGLGQVLLVHRLGRLEASETVLVAVVSAPSRTPCFEGCAWIVDEIKKESLIELVELP